MTNAKTLLDLVPESLLPLSKTEKALCVAAQKSGWAYFTKSNQCLDEWGQGNIHALPRNPSKAKNLPVIRAEVVAWILTDKRAHEFLTHTGLTICGARIEGELDASFAVLPWQFRLLRCFVPGGMLLQDAEFGLLNFEGSHVHGVGDALNADRIQVKGGVFLRNGFAAVGQVRFLGADVGGDFDCDGSFRAKPEGQKLASADRALSADGIKVRGSVFLNNGFTAVGMVRFLGADVEGNFDCGNASFQAKPEGQELASADRALNADGIKVKGNVFLSDGFTAVGMVRFLGADIGGDFACRAGQFLNQNGDALSADRIKVKGGVFLNDGLIAKGEVRFPSADVGGDFACRAGKFHNRNGQALNADVRAHGDLDKL